MQQKNTYPVNTSEEREEMTDRGRNGEREERGNDRGNDRKQRKMKTKQESDAGEVKRALDMLKEKCDKEREVKEKQTLSLSLSLPREASRTSVVLTGYAARFS